MGLFDYVGLKVSFCPFCAEPIPPDDYYQSKSGKRVLNTYKSREVWESMNPDMSFYTLSQTCPACKENYALQVSNKSPEHLAVIEKQWQKTKQKMIDDQTASHPNHNWNGIDKVCFMNAWCSKCRDLGVENGDVPPDASEFLIEAQKKVREMRHLSSKELWEGLDSFGYENIPGVMETYE